MDKKIIIWGTGTVCKEFKEKIEKAEIVAYIDNNFTDNQIDGIPVFRLADVKKGKFDYDYIVVANAFSNEIYEECLVENMDMERLIFLRPLEPTEQVELKNRNLELLLDIAPAYLEETLKESDRRMGIDKVDKPQMDCNPVYYYDYFRYRTFELIAEQIQDLQGDVAEVGVYRGNFARLINMKFPQDTFYLFDTFEGFKEEEANKELLMGNCNREFIERFRETSLERVMKLMQYPDKCVFKVGFFPETTEGINATFKFVSIDVDFEDSTYLALVFFMRDLYRVALYLYTIITKEC